MLGALKQSLFILLFLAVTAYADEQSEKLEHIRSEIKKISAVLEKNLGQRNSLQSRLRENEKQLNSINRELHQLNQSITQKQNKLGSLSQQKQALSIDLKQQQQRLSEQILSAYKIGRQEQIKLLLNQTEPATLNRVLNYYHYFNQARVTLIQEVNQHLTQIDQLQNDISAQLLALEQLNRQKQSVAEQLTQGRHKRQALLLQINQQIEQYGQQIDQLRADEKRVRALIQSLSGLLQDIPADLINYSFKQQKGRLNWPTNGMLQHKFGDPRGNSDLVWQGISIRAPQGQAIHAISHGRVAFADWLQGYGLLLIIDHRDGFMSLYGHNQMLYKETGDWVNQGELIASVGNSGGLTEPRLYLEIRQQGIPLNPEHWFNARLQASRD